MVTVECVDFDDGFNTKVCSVDHIIIISPQSERSELGAFYFCQGVLSGYCCVCESGYYHVKKKGYCNEVGYRGSSEMSQIWVLW